MAALAGNHQPTLLAAPARDWIRATVSPWGFWCVRCDARLTYDTPAPIHQHLDDAHRFQAAHAGCQRPAEEIA